MDLCGCEIFILEQKPQDYISAWKMRDIIFLEQFENYGFFSQPTYLCGIETTIYNVISTPKPN